MGSIPGWFGEAGEKKFFSAVIIWLAQIQMQFKALKSPLL